MLGRALMVVMHEDEFGTSWTQYRKELQLAPAEDLADNRAFRQTSYVTDKGEPLKTWRAVDMLELRSGGGSGSEPLFRKFHWVESPPR